MARIGHKETSLVQIVDELRPHVARTKGRTVVEHATAVAVSAWGGAACLENSFLLNVAMLAVKVGGAPATYLCRPSAAALVHATDLHSIPDRPPALLRSAGIVETRRPETGERLWGTIVSLGWFSLDVADVGPFPQSLRGIHLVAFKFPVGGRAAIWRPAWTAAELDPQQPQRQTSLLIDDVDARHELPRQAARFLIVMGLLAEATHSPLRIELDKRERRTRHVYLADRLPTSRPIETTAPAVTPDARAGSAVTVAGHLKRQRYGAGNSQTKWIYVASYEARRWFAPRWDVSHTDDGSSAQSIIDEE